MTIYRNKFVTSLLLVLTLASVQLVQHSSLHDHNDHDAVDCGLCHFGSTGKITLEKNPLPEFEKTGFLIQDYFQFFSPSTYFSFSQPRAPPIKFS